MTDYTLQIDNLTKTFGRRLIFKDINFTFKSGKIFGITGPNGSGKSTLAKIIIGSLSLTKGKVIHKINDKIIDTYELHNYFGFASPYLNLYDEFTAEENLMYLNKIRGINYNKEKAHHLLNEFLLLKRKDDYIKGYSSGMKHRLKIISALLHEPELIILDEPTSNLDNSGKTKVYEIIEKEGNEHLVIIASNEDADLSFCGEVLNLEKYKN